MFIKVILRQFTEVSSPQPQAHSGHGEHDGPICLSQTLLQLMNDTSRRGVWVRELTDVGRSLGTMRSSALAPVPVDSDDEKRRSRVSGGRCS